MSAARGTCGIANVVHQLALYLAARLPHTIPDDRRAPAAQDTAHGLPAPTGAPFNEQAIRF
eukprot:4322213-Pleurochrysis_carterae.AAC.4